MKLLKKIFIITGPLLGGILVSLLINTSSYNVINQPPYSPPAIVFPIVWTILYLLMGISLFLISKIPNNNKLIKAFITQIIVNYIWPFLFFEFNFYCFSALWLILLIYFTLLMIKKFLAIKKIAGYLQFPYFLWLIFALYLNIGVAVLN